MSATLTIYDETLAGEKTWAFTLESLTERMTVRELIRARIYQEVQDYSQRQPDTYHGLVQPSHSEIVLNGFRLRERRQIRWEEQYETALAAFERNGFFILVGDRQAESLDESFEVAVETAVSFIRLTPLVGG